MVFTSDFIIYGGGHYRPDVYKSVLDFGKGVLRMSNEMAIQENNDAMLTMIERVASNPDADIAKMEKLLEMRNQEITRQAKGEFYAAFASMQADLPQVEEKTKGHQKNYASFEDINKKVQPILQKHGFAISFRIKQEAALITVTAVLSHKNGYTESTDISLPHDGGGSKNSVQAVGSSTSYGKRYAMCAILNIVTCGEDDDAKASDENATIAQREIISRLFKGCSPEQQDYFTKRMGEIVSLKKKDVDAAMALLNNILKKREANANN